MYRTVAVIWVKCLNYSPCGPIGGWCCGWPPAAVICGGPFICGGICGGPFMCGGPGWPWPGSICVPGGAPDGPPWPCGCCATPPGCCWPGFPACCCDCCGPCGGGPPGCCCCDGGNDPGGPPGGGYGLCGDWPAGVPCDGGPIIGLGACGGGIGAFCCGDGDAIIEPLSRLALRRPMIYVYPQSRGTYK